MESHDVTIHYFDSQYRPNLNQLSTDYETTLLLPKDHNKISLYSISIPKSYYLIPAGYNTFTLSDKDSLVTYVITLPVGNYSISELLTTLNSALSSPNNLHIAVTFSGQTGKLTFTTTSNRHYSSIFNLKLRKIFGFNSNPTFIHSSPPVVSDNIVNLQPLQTITMCCSLVRGNSYDYTSNILHQLIVNTSVDFSYVTYQTTDHIFIGKDIAVPSVEVETPIRFRISLLDDDELPLLINGLEVVFQLVTWAEPSISIVKSQFNLLKDYLQYRVNRDRIEDSKTANKM